MSSPNSANEKPIAAFVGIDWADQKHDIVLCAATGNAQFEHRRIGSHPDALAEGLWKCKDVLVLKAES